MRQQSVKDLPPFPMVSFRTRLYGYMRCLLIPIKKLSFFICLGIAVVGCSGSPAKVSTQTPQQYADDVLADKSVDGLCERYQRDVPINKCRARVGKWAHLCPTVVKGIQLEIERRSLPPDYCVRRSHYDSKSEFDAKWTSELYKIDLLRITANTMKDTDFCETGGVHKIIIEGQISPDSSFAIGRLLEKLKPCANQSGKPLVAVTVSLQSGGGLLEDGYLMGETFRKYGITTVIEDGQGCASSCAVAFLGGRKRIIEDEGSILFHAPYFSGKNEYGKRDIDCEVGQDSLDELKSYYRNITDPETGDRLFERTMWYCSAEDGWVVTGGAAAELYGIATEK